MDRSFNPLNVTQFWQPFRQDTRRRYDCLPFHSNYPELLRSCEVLAFLLRSYTAWEMTCAGLGHPGGSFSEAEFLAVLFNYVLRFDPKDPKWPNRDVFYLSKCHAAPALYTALSIYGYFPIQQLKCYGMWGSGLESHPDSRLTPGIEVSGGSLGQIPGVAVGRALAIRQNGPDQNDRVVYALLGDGECNEGSVWEAFMAAGHYKLDNLVFVIDYNKVEAKGFISQDMSLEPLTDKLRSFNLHVFETQNGHNVSELINTINDMIAQRRGKPQVLVLNTIKGKKVQQCQFNPNWHTSAPRNIESAGIWLEEIWDQDGRRLGIPEEFYKTLIQAIEIVPPVHIDTETIIDKQQ